MRVAIGLAAAVIVMAGAAGAAAPPRGPVPPGYIAFTEPPPPPGGAPMMRITEYGPATGHTYKINFSAGDEIVSGMTEVADRLKLKQGTITGIGGFGSATLAWYDPAVGHFKLIQVDQKTEISGFTGTMSTNAAGQGVFHAHVVLTLSDGSTKSGHLVSGKINPIGEIFVTDLGEGKPLPR